MTSEKSAGTVLVICSDLLFASRITGTAQQLNLNASVVADPSDLSESPETADCRCVIVDLTHPTADIETLRAAFAEARQPTFIAFGPHVETERLAAARQAGCDIVLPRSRFAAELVSLLQEHGKG